MANLHADFARALANGIASRTLTSCSRWAEKRRVMGHPFPGPYSWEHHPWVKELHDSWAPFTYCMKGAQTGVTEAAINRALYTLDKLKRDVLYVLPTSTAASDFSKARFGSALEHSPYLKSIFTETNAVNIKRAGANTLYIRGSRGKASLISIPVSELILDELDAMEQQQLWLALERLSGQVHKHVWGISTPTIPDFGIHKVYTGSTQEHFFFKCPSCGRRTELIWPDCIVICGEHTADPRCNESYLKCKECGGTLHQQDKPRFLAEGKWESTDANGNKEIRGFQISQLYSFTVSPGELVVAYFRGFGDEFAAKEFHNSKLGLPYIGSVRRLRTECWTRLFGLTRQRNDDRATPARSSSRWVGTRASGTPAWCASGCRPAVDRARTWPRLMTAKCSGTASSRMGKCGRGSRS